MEGLDSRPRWQPWQVVAVVAALLFLPWLHQRSLWYPDEPDVAEPTISMLESGDWVVPRHNDEAWLDYPPVTYWLGAISSSVAGAWSPFALRLPVALLATLLAALTAWATTRLAGRAAGLWAGLTMVTAPHFAYQATNFHPDMAFAVFIALGIAAYARGAGDGSGRPRYLWMVAGFACFGGAMLSKGPLGLLLPGLILFVWHAVQRQWGAMLRLAPLALVSIAVSLAWYGPLIGALGWQEVSTELYLQNFARYEDTSRGHGGKGWWYYLERLWVDWAPWSLLLPGAVAAAFAARRRDPWVRLALLWIFLSVAFFTLAATKRQVYLLPVYPAIAFLIGRWVGAALEDGRRSLPRAMQILGGLCAVVGLVLLGAAIFTGPLEERLARSELPLDEFRLPLLVLGASLGGGGIVAFLAARRGRPQRGLGAAAVGLWLCYAVAFGGILPRLDGGKSYGEAVRALRASAGEEPFGFYPPDIQNKRAGFRVEDPAFMPLEVLSSPEEVEAYLSSGSRLVILHPSREAEIGGSERGERPRQEIELGSRKFVVLGPEVDPEVEGPEASEPTP